MRVERNVRLLSGRLNAAASERDIQWARDCCSFSREIQLGIWQFRPSFDYVEKTVLPLLERACKEVRKSARPRSGFAPLANNIKIRATNIRSVYLRSKIAPMWLFRKVRRRTVGEIFAPAPACH